MNDDTVASYHAVINLLDKDITEHRAEIVSRQAQIDETQHTITVLRRRLSQEQEALTVLESK